MKRLLVCLIALSLVTVGVGCSATQRGNTAGTTLAPLVIGVSKHPVPLDFERGKLTSLPKYIPGSTVGSQVDLRGYDLSALPVADRLVDLLNADFDSVTKWPSVLPAGFDPNWVMELGKDPGLGVRSLHDSGITGKGIGIAIIDQTLLVDHTEYKDRLIHYEEIHDLESESVMHGAALASIAVGKTVGVAPEADLYYIAETNGEFTPNGLGFNYDFTWLAKSVDRVLEINQTLPVDKKIRVIAIAIGWSPNQAGYSEIVAAVKRAEKAGIFVVSSSLYETSGQRMYFHGLGRDPNKDPNDPSSYAPGSWWAQRFFAGENVFPMEPLLIPMDARSVASPTGVNDYVYYSQGGWSWSIPYVAGIYALACQVKPDITPKEFWSTGLATGDTIQVPKDGQSYSLGKIINPEKLMAALAEK